MLYYVLYVLSIVPTPLLLQVGTLSTILLVPCFHYSATSHLAFLLWSDTQYVASRDDQSDGEAQLSVLASFVFIIRHSRDRTCD